MVCLHRHTWILGGAFSESEGDDGCGTYGRISEE